MVTVPVRSGCLGRAFGARRSGREPNRSPNGLARRVGQVPGMASPQGRPGSCRPKGDPRREHRQRRDPEHGSVIVQGASAAVGTRARNADSESGQHHQPALGGSDVREPATSPSPVQLINLHQTKGPEADAIVILYGDDDSHGYDDEPFVEGSRLLYVILTRARTEVTVIFGHVEGQRVAAMPRLRSASSSSGTLT
jgi:hypothetical protein